MVHKETRQTKYGSKAQGLVEFALVLPVLIIIAFGVMDLARVFFAIITITNASREGARYLTLHPEDILPDGAGVVFSGTKNAAARESLGAIVSILPANVTASCINVNTLPGCDAGYPAVVTVSYNFRLILGWFWPAPLNLTRTTRMMVP